MRIRARGYGPAMRRVLSAAVAAALLVVPSACGGNDEDDVREALASFAAASEAKDANAVCQRLSPESRELLERAGTMRAGRRRRCAQVPFRGEKGDPGASLNEFEAGAEDLAVEVSGDTATAREKGSEPLRLRQVDGEWGLDLASIRAVSYSLQAGIACGETRVRELRRPLPAPTRAGLARATRRQAQDLAELRARIARLRPDRPDARAHRTLLRELDTQIRVVRAVAAQTAGVVEVGKAFNRGARRIAQSDRRLVAAQRKLGFACLGPQAAENASQYRTQAARICTTAGRRIGRLREPRSPDAAVAYLRRLEGAGRGAMRRLSRLNPPDALAPRHRDSIAAYRDTLDVLAAERRTIAAGRDPTGDVERLERSSVRASFSFRQLALPTCAAL